MNELQVFGFEGRNVRVVEKDGNPWWVAKDVCDILDIGNVSQALTRLDDDERGIISNDILGTEQSMLSVNEFGVYTLVLSSRKPEAKAFKRWITHEVLPAIRKTGSYGIPEIIAPPPIGLVTSVNRSVYLKVLSPKQAEAMILASCAEKAQAIKAKSARFVGALPISANPLSDLFSHAEFHGWREKLAENPRAYSPIGIERSVLNGGNDLRIAHNHKALIRIAGKDYKEQLKRDPAYIETKSARIFNAVETALIFDWRKVTEGQEAAHA